MLDGKAFGAEMTEIVKGYVDRATAPLLQRIETLEKRQPEKGEKGDPGERGERGLSGVSIRDGFRQEGGVLILTLSDGTTRDLGTFVGKDGSDGKDGADGLPGEPGKDGRDGFSIDDFDCRVLDDDRTIELAFRSGEHEHVASLKWPTMIYRNVFKEGSEYEAGDVVTWGGSLWHCDEKTMEKPDAGPWRLCVKKGRDGKDAK